MYSLYVDVQINKRESDFAGILTPPENISEKSNGLYFFPIENVCFIENNLNMKTNFEGEKKHYPLFQCQ